VRDIRPGPASGIDVVPFGVLLGPNEQFLDVHGTLFFQANDGVHGVELWKAVLPRSDQPGG
jgi:hypothetical protein